MKRILLLIIFALIVFIIFRTSTFGWRLWSKSFMDNKGENTQLAEQLKHHVYKLAEEIGERSVFQYEKLKQAENYIANQLVSFGYNVEFQNYSVLDKTANNIIATKTGSHRPKEIIIVGAHYDTCFNPGADDNASAVAGLLELARSMSVRQTNCTIKFIAFVNEEPPFFKTENMGSSVYVRYAKEKMEDIKAVIILEMIGYYTDEPNSQRYPPFFGLFYPNKGNFITVVGNFSCRGLVRKVVLSFKKQTLFPIESVVTFSFVPGIDFSDHWSFWQEGYPAVMITDTAFYRNPNYHSSADTYETLNYESLAEVAKGLNAVLIELVK